MYTKKLLKLYGKKTNNIFPVYFLLVMIFDFGKDD